MEQFSQKRHDEAAARLAQSQARYRAMQAKMQAAYADACAKLDARVSATSSNPA